METWGEMGEKGRYSLVRVWGPEKGLINQVINAEKNKVDCSPSRVSPISVGSIEDP